MWIVLLLMDNSFIYKKSRNCLTTTTKRMWSFWEEQKPLKHLWTRMLAVQAAWAAAAQAVLAGGMIRQYWCLYWLVLLQVLKMMLHVLVCIGSCIGLYLSLYWYWNVLGSYWWMYWHCRLPRQCWQGAWFDSTDACIGCTIASIEMMLHVVLVLDLLLVCIWACIDLHWNVLGSVWASVLAHLGCAWIFNSFDGALPSEREKQSWFDWTIEISPFIGWALLGQFSARRSPFQVSHHIANCVRRSLTSYTLQPARSPLPHAALAPDH